MSEKRLSRWYFGGLASAGAACCTHPLDLLKVHLQTQQEGKLSILRLTLKIVKHQGVLALYNGLSASLLRQLTYSTTRFGIYEVAKQAVSPSGESVPFYQRVLMASVAGAAGGLVGTPADMINVRMQNDIKIPVESRRKSWMSISAPSFGWPKNLQTSLEVLSQLQEGADINIQDPQYKTHQSGQADKIISRHVQTEPTLI